MGKIMNQNKMYSNSFIKVFFFSPTPFPEAEYAFQQRKKIIPLIMQGGYKPDGWLGMILGAKLYYDFSGKYTYESRIDQLLKALRDAAGIGGGDTADGGVSKLKATYQVEPEKTAVVCQQVTSLSDHLARLFLK